MRSRGDGSSFGGQSSRNQRSTSANTNRFEGRLDLKFARAGYGMVGEDDIVRCKASGRKRTGFFKSSLSIEMDKLLFGREVNLHWMVDSPAAGSSPSIGRRKPRPARHRY